VISSNAPLDTQRVFQKAAREIGADFVFWLQDIYSEGISRVVPRKLPVLGHFVAAFYRWLEFSMLGSSDRVVAITPDFLPILTAKGISADKVDVIENWAPLNELPTFPRGNDWATANMHPDKLRFVYSGTLGYKHDPSLLLELAQREPGVHVHVFSEGDPASGLARDAQAAGVTNLSVHPWVPFADLPKMLSGADVFVAMIEAEAGVFRAVQDPDLSGCWPPHSGVGSARKPFCAHDRKQRGRPCRPARRSRRLYGARHRIGG
jgi:hypothetical protein